MTKGSLPAVPRVPLNHAGSHSTADALDACWTAIGEDCATVTAKSGIEDAVDLAGYFGTPHEVEAAATAWAVEAQRLVDAWRGARGLLGEAVQRRAEAAEAERILRPRQSSTTLLPRLDQAVLGAKRQARLVPGKVGNPEWSVATRQRRPQAASGGDEVYDTMWNIYLALGSAGLWWRQLPSDPEEVEILKRATLRGAYRYHPDRVRGYLSTLRRWQSWTHRVGLSAEAQAKPSALQLIRFLDEVAAGGPTAASGVVAGLSWWTEHIGYPFPLDDPLLADFAKPEVGHEVVQRPSLTMGACVGLVRMAQANAGTISQLARLVLLVVASGLRFGHIQRSRYQGMSTRLVLARCSRGKRKTRGTQPGFEWAAPRVLIPGADILGPLHPLLFDLPVRETTQEGFLVPDIVMEKGTLSPASAWSPQPMPASKFLLVLRVLIQLMGIEQAQRFSTRSLRRLLPSLALALQVPEEWKCALGDWVEHVRPNPSNKGSGASRPAVADMPLLYSDDRRATAGETKLTVWSVAGLRIAEAEGEGETAAQQAHHVIVRGVGEFPQVPAWSWHSFRALASSPEEMAAAVARDPRWAAAYECPSPPQPQPRATPASAYGRFARRTSGALAWGKALKTAQKDATAPTPPVSAGPSQPDSASPEGVAGRERGMTPEGSPSPEATPRREESAPSPASGASPGKPTKRRRRPASEDSAASVDSMGPVSEPPSPQSGELLLAVQGAQVAWFVQPRSSGSRMHLAETAEWPMVAWCRDAPFTRGPSDAGYGLRSALQMPATMCPSCLDRLSPSLRQAWEDCT